MKKSIIYSLMIILSLMVITACSKPCPKIKYPQLNAINKIPKSDIVVIQGRMDHNSTKEAFKTIKALRVSENYYYALIEQYRKDFIE